MSQRLENVLDQNEQMIKNDEKLGLVKEFGQVFMIEIFINKNYFGSRMITFSISFVRTDECYYFLKGFLSSNFVTKYEKRTLQNSIQTEAQRCSK